MNTDTLELIGKGQDLVRYMRGFNEQTWADWLDQCLDAIRSGQLHGVYDLLSVYQGMAGIQDLYLCQEAGHTVTAAKEIAVNEQLLVMVARLHQCARSVSDRLATEASIRAAAREQRRAHGHASSSFS